jgi:mRNA-degrading endonuclease RelE of RelBE toxin-antitoxin system
MKKRRKSSPEKAVAEGAFDLRFTQDASDEITALDGSIKQKLKKALENKIAKNPEGYGTPLRSPLSGYWKHEFATHRLIYRIYADERIALVCAVGPRKSGDAEDVYEQLKSVAAAGRLAEQVASALKHLVLTPTKKK